MKTVAIDVRLIGRNRTGDEAVFRNLVRELLRRDDGLTYILLTDRGDAETERSIIEAVGRDGELPSFAEIRALPSSGRFQWNLLSVPAYLFRERIDVFHTQYLLPFAIPRRTKVIAHIHDVSFRAHPEFIGWTDRLFLSSLIPRTMRRADVIAVPSRFTRDEVVELYGVPDDRVSIISNAIDPSFLEHATSGTADTTRIRELYGLPERYILSVGTMQPRKNVPTLVHAFAALRRRIPNLSLVLVGNRGGKHYDTEIEAAIRKEGVSDCVRFPGYVAQRDMPALYREADAMAFPSRYEGFGIPLLEAMAVGVPVAASDIPPFREVGGSAVSYFDPKNVADCSETLYTLCTDAETREARLRSGKDRVGLFSWSASAARLVAEYRRLTE